MENGVGWISHRSSASPTPPETPIGALPYRWEDGNRLLGCFPSGESLVQATAFQNPNYSVGNYYAELETLQSAFSGLALRNARRSPYGHGSGGAGVVNVSQLQQLEGHSLPVPVFDFDRDRPRFDASRSALSSRNLAEHGTIRYVFGNRGVDFYGSSSSAYSPPSNLFSRGFEGSTSSLFGVETATESPGRNYPCGMVDCSCQYKYSGFQSYQQLQPPLSDRQKFIANVSNGARAYPHDYADNGQINRRNSRPQLEFAAGSINLMDLRGNVVSWAMDQNRCRILQSKIQEAKEEEIQMVLAEVIDHISDLMTHPCGNYFIQKLIDICSDEQKSHLIFSVIEDSRQLTYVCCDNHGTRCIQKLLENLKSPRLISQFMSAIQPGVVKLIKDANGYHVINYCLSSFSAQQNKYIVMEVVDNCFDIARDINGCRGINQCIGNSEGEDRYRLISEIIECALPLAEDCYGNYVVQYILELKNVQFNSRIQMKLTGNFVSLSRNKYGSHVVEKCLRVADFYQSSDIILELLKSPMLLPNDVYGNFVIQAALEVAQGDAEIGLHELIEAHTQTLRSNMYGRKVLEAYEKKRVTARVNLYYHQSARKRESQEPFDVPGRCSRLGCP